MPPRVMLVPAGVSLPPGVHPVGLVARIASASAGLGLEDVGFGTTPAAAGGGLRFSCAVLSSLHMLSSKGLVLGFASAAGLGSSTASGTSLLVAAATAGSEAEGGDGDDSADAKRDRYEEMKQAVLLSWEWRYTDEDSLY